MDDRLVSVMLALDGLDFTEQLSVLTAALAALLRTDPKIDVPRICKSIPTIVQKTHDDMTPEMFYLLTQRIAQDKFVRRVQEIRK